MSIWVLSVASNFSDAPLHSGNIPKPQHWKSDESTDVEGTSAEEDQDWNDDRDADWTVDSEGRSSLSGRNVCALVASDGQASLWRSISETDLLVSEEEVNQTFACWKEDSVGITGLCGPELDELLLANVRNHGWDTEQYLSEVLVAGFEESERMTSEEYRKVFARARLVLPCAAPCAVGDVCLVCRERVLGDSVGPCGYCLHSACLAEGLRVQVLCGCSERHRSCVYCGELPYEPVPCAQMMDLCKALEELHVELEDIFLEQYITRDELPLVQQWPATLQLTLRAVEPWRLRNVFENFFDARRSQLICSAEIALPILMSWDLLVVDKPADAKSRRAQSRYWRRLLVRALAASYPCGNPHCQHEFCSLCLHDWTSATYNASLCIGRSEASH